MSRPQTSKNGQRRFAEKRIRRPRVEVGATKEDVLARLDRLRLYLHPGATWRKAKPLLANGAGRQELLEAGVCVEGPKMDDVLGAKR